MYAAEFPLMVVHHEVRVCVADCTAGHRWNSLRCSHKGLCLANCWALIVEEADCLEDFPLKLPTGC